MRKITQQEYEQWIALAKAHGFADEGGAFGLGRYVVEGWQDGYLVMRVITPIPAGLYTEDLQKKTPPILFDRTVTGEIILPGRWWQHTFERVSAQDEVPADVRATAATAARVVTISDAYLPPNTDTIEISAPDEDGNMVIHEALAPGTVMRMRIQRYGDV